MKHIMILYFFFTEEDVAAMDKEKRKQDFFKRASTPFLLKLYRQYAHSSNWNLGVDFNEDTPSTKIDIYDAHWTKSLLKKGEKVTASNMKYIRTDLNEIKKILSERPHVKGKKESKEKRQKLAKKKS